MSDVTEPPAPRPFGAADWDERYRGSQTVWGAAPNRFVEQQLRDLPPGRALDLACGEGRNAIWLAGSGWQVTGVDFSAVAIDKARAAASHAGVQVDWRVADVLTFSLEQPADLALLCYLQLPPAGRRAALSRAAAGLRPGGTLFLVAHDRDNIEHGVGGPQDPSVLYTAAGLVDDLHATDLVIDVAEQVTRPVEGAERPALDVLLRAHRPA